MRYVGGKRRLAPYIVPIIQNAINGRQVYVEPFVGSFNIVPRIKAYRRIASDNHPYLIALYRAIRGGWKPPTSLSEDEYYHIRNNKQKYPSYLVGFVGFACSYASKWFGGYARGKERNYALQGYNSLLKKAPHLKGIEILYKDYRTVRAPPRSVIYCDPPYRNTTKYATARSFNSNEFWDWVRVQVVEGHSVFVSEFEAPNDFYSIWSMERATSLTKNTGLHSRTEHLFIHETQSEGVCSI